MAANSTAAAYEYSLGFGMMLVIYLGESMLANELLAKTKGHEMGWVWVALGFAMAFAFPIALFSYASAKLNPAMLMAHWVYLGMPTGNFFALAASECLGGFLGAVFVWLHYAPHFKSIPEPPPANARDALLRPRDYVGPSGARIASYESGTRALKSHRPALQGGLLDDAVFYLRGRAMTPSEMGDQVLHRGERLEPGGGLRRRSIQVADLQRQLQDADVQYHARGDRAASAQAAGALQPPAVSAPRAATYGTDTGAKSALPSKCSGAESGGSSAGAGSDEADKAGADKAPAGDSGARGAAGHGGHGDGVHAARTSSGEGGGDLYAAALVADQNAKLSVFATRPAIYSPVFNWLTELLGTTALICGALWIDERGKMIYATADDLWPTLNGLYVGLFVFIFVLGFGGPTGIAANPARDTAPRLAHWLLPIPNKGPSEWYYAWIPLTASLTGGLVGGGLFTLLNKLNQSNVNAMDVFDGL